VGMDREARRGIQRVKGEIHKRTSINNTRSKQKNENESKYIRLCDRGSIIYEV